MPSPTGKPKSDCVKIAICFNFMRQKNAAAVKTAVDVHEVDADVSLRENRFSRACWDATREMTQWGEEGNLKIVVI